MLIHTSCRSESSNYSLVVLDCEVSNRSVQTLLEARYLQPTNIAAQQGDSDEATEDKETIADIDERENDDNVEKVNAKRDSSVNNETIFE